MKEQQLSGLVSPVTGRRVLEKDHVFVGNENNIEAPVPVSDIAGLPPLCEDQIWVGNQMPKQCPMKVAMPIRLQLILRVNLISSFVKDLSIHLMELDYFS